jgi:hypothetical protein
MDMLSKKIAVVKVQIIWGMGWDLRKNFLVSREDKESSKVKSG